MAKNVYLFLAEGCEECEALITVDILRRGGVDVTTVSISDSEYITSSHNITFKADAKLSEINKDAADMLILPGGMPGTNNLMACKELTDLVVKYNTAGKRIAAVCAAPTIFGQLGLLNGKRATCFKGMEDKLTGAIVSEEQVVTDGTITTSRGLGTTIPFALELLKLLVSEEAANMISSKIIYTA
ncbi:MAG: DJ-1/PfpI family protein [Lachnospiraceae bacterium]|nr:DJ-1/PfpI family protein [Lachnospiraceae bacterium]